MSSKKINIIELHCEKILVALAGLLLAFVTVWELAVISIGVKVGSETISLENLQEKLVKKEGDLSRKLEPNSPSPLELPEPKNVSNAEIFESNRTGPIAPGGSILPNQPFFGKLLAGELRSTNQWFYEPNFAAGKMHGVVVTTDAFDTSAINAEMLAGIQKENPDFAARFLTSNSAEITPDVTWATPWVIIDLDSLRGELAREDKAKSPPLDAIPRPWINDTLYILDVVFERQEKQSDGSWSQSTIVTVVPGQESWRPAVEADASNASTRDTVFANLSDYDMQIDVLQPQFLPMKKHNFHAPVLGSGSATPKVAPEEIIRQLSAKKIKKSKADLARLEADLKEAGGPLAPPADAGGGSDEGSGGGKDKGGGGGFGMGGGGSMKKNDPGVTEGPESQSRKDRIRLTKRVGLATKALQKLETDFAKKYPTAAKTPGNVDQAKESKQSFKETKDVVAWTHDFDVREGATYQYRATLKVYNPFFTRKILLVTDQQKLSSGLTVSSISSAWGDEVSIPLATSFFLTQGSARDGIGGRRLSIDLFRYSNGELRSSSEVLTPGDPVGQSGGVKSNGVDFSTPWYLADIFDDEGNDQNGGVFAIFEQRNNAGEVIQEIRTLADKDSEKYKEFKQMLPAPSSKRSPAEAPKS